MSIRRGYWFLAGETYDGPFQTIREAKEASSALNPATHPHVSIRAMVALERRNERGEWQTVH